MSVHNSADMDSERTFKLRLPGLNVDCMTYGMLKLANDDLLALFNETLFHSTAGAVFSILFEHYVTATFHNEC